MVMGQHSLAARAPFFVALARSVTKPLGSVLGTWDGGLDCVGVEVVGTMLLLVGGLLGLDDDVSILTVVGWVLGDADALFGDADG